MTLAALGRGGAALVAGLLVAGSLGWSPPAAAAPRPAAACTGATGITVVVDFGDLAGGVQHRCVTQSVTSGFDALRKAGFTVEATIRFPGLLCRIDGKPADEGCVNAPPADRYWSYWTAPALGGTWTYSDQGGGNRVPPQGSVEGWAFSVGCDRRPGGTCSSPSPTTTTTTTRRTTTTTTPVARGGPVTTTPSTDGGGAEDASTSTTAPAVAGGSSTTVAPGDRAPAAGEPGDEDALGAEPAAAVSSDGGGGGSGGSAVGVVVVAVVVLALVAAAALTARRRRTDGTGP